MLLNVDWRNPVDHLDVNSDSRISAIDALLVINELNRLGSGQLPSLKDPTQPYFDTNGDSRVNALDALWVINHLNSPNQHRQLSGGLLFDSQQDIHITMGHSDDETTRLYRMQIDTTGFVNSPDRLLDDLLSVYLVNPTDSTKTLLDRGTNGTSLFSLSGRGAEMATGLVRWDGSVLEIDVGSIPAMNTGILRAQLLSRSPTSQAFVNLKPLSNELVEEIEPGQLLQRNDLLRSSGASLNLAQLTTTDSIRASISNVRYQRTSGTFIAEVEIQNLDSAVGRDVAMVLHGLPSGVQVTNASGTDSQGRPYLNLREAIRSGGLGRNERSDRVELLISNPNRIPLNLEASILVGQPNRAPTIPVIANQTVMPGNRIEIELGATDPDGDRLTYSVRSANSDSIALPTARLDTGNGRLVIEPTPTQLGQYQVEILASDGVLTSSRTFNVNVIADPITTTRVSGRVLDVDLTPIAGMRVEIGGVQALTQFDGKFLLDLGSGPLASDTLRVRGDAYSDSQRPNLAYPFIAEKLPFMFGREVYARYNNVLERAIYLPKLNAGDPVNPSVNTTVSATLRPGQAPVEVEIAAGTLLTQQGAPFTGNLSITEVPVDRTPAALPPNLLPDFLVTIQPGEMTFTNPAPVSFPNTAGWAPGTPMDLWSINPVTGEFEIVGKMRVSADGGLIETISGGIRNSSWHFPSRPPDENQDPKDDDENQDEECPSCEERAAATSSVELHSGALLEQHDLVSYQSLGVTRQLTLHYDSQKADSRPILHFGVNNVQPGDDRRLVARLEFSDGQVSQQVPGFTGGMGLSGGEHFWRLPTSTSDVKVALQGDLRNLPSGIFEYNLTRGILRSPSGGNFTGTTTTSTGDILHVNAIDSPFGAGWRLGGIQQMIRTSNGRVLFVDGDGSNLVFRPGQQGAFISPPGDFSVLVENANGTFTRTFKDRSVYHFDTEGRLVSMTDRNGNVTQHIYESGRLTRIIDPSGLETLFAYTGNRVTAITDPAGRVTRLSHDASGNLTRIMDPDGSSRAFEYDGDHHLVSELDKLGRREESLYGYHGRVIRAVRKDGTRVHFEPIQTMVLQPASSTSSPTNPPVASLAAASAVARNADANGNLTSTVLDRLGQSVSSVDSGGSKGRVTRNGNNLIESQFDARGLETSFTYDDRGNVLSVTDDIIRQGGSTGPLFPGEVFSVGDRPNSVTVGDINGDGRPDLATANSASNDVSVLLGNGDGTFANEQRFAVGVSPESVAVGDFNGDGRPDLVTTNSSSDDVSVLLGNGDGTFSIQQRFAVESFPRSIALGDFNRDGRLDLATITNGVSVLLGNGDGTFASEQTFETGNASNSVVVGDFNGDGRPDLAASTTGNSSSIISLLFGNGDGTFRSPEFISVGGSPISATVGDFNGDDRPDLVTENYRSRDLSLLLNNGDGTFAERRFAQGSFSTLVTVGDFNGDGKLDLATRNREFDGISVLLGNGDGSFASQQRFEVGSSPDSMTVGDFNGDGRLDLGTASSSGNEVSVVFGNGDGTFASQQSFSVGDSPGSVSVGDFNGDGQPDLATANYFDADVSVLLGNGDGTFVSQQRFAVGSNPRSMTLGDFNGDSRLDVVTASSTYDDVSVLLGNGDGTFSSQQRFSVGGRPESVAVGDFNGDGRLDLVTANILSYDLSVLLGNGDGTFAGQQRFAERTYPESVAVGDFNGDGRLDLATSNGVRYDLSVFFGNGDGTFANEQRFPLGGRFPLSVGDFNGDGRLDLAAANSSDSEVWVLMGNGDGSFANEQRFAVGELPRSVVVGDFNGDGRTDLATVNGGTDDVSLLLGNGDGTFDNEQRFATLFGAESVTVGDFNGDGRLDLATGNSYSVSVLLNRGGAAGGTVPPRRYTYESAFNQLTSSTDELGRQTLYEIDPATGNQLSTTQVVGQLDSTSNGETDDRRTIFTYTSLGLLDTITDPLGRVTDFDYDSRGRLTSVTHAKGTADEAIMRYEYDLAGNQTAMIDGKGNRTTYEYDLLNRLIKTTEADPDGTGPLFPPVTTLVYDAAGNMTSTTDANGNTSSSRFDDLNRLIESTGPDPDGTGPLPAPITRYSYDPVGNVGSVTDPNGNTTRYRYDGRNRRIESIDPDGGITKFSYNTDNNLSQVTDPVGNVTKFRYDARDRLFEEIDPLGKSILYGYDAANNLVQKTDRNGRVTKYSYDDLNRLIKEEWIGAADAVVNTITYRYDLAGNLLSVDDKDSKLTYVYDARNRVKSVDNTGTPGAPSVILTYAYDDNSNVLSVTDTINAAPGATTSYTYDALDRLVVLGQSGNQVSDKRVNFTYNALGQYSAIDRYRDLAGTQLVIGTDYNYDQQNRLTRIDHKNAANTSVAFYDYEYDIASRISKITDVDDSTNYEYDDRDQLIRADHADAVFADESYTYDANGNRTNSHLHGSGYITGPGNRLLSDGTYNYEYNNEGNMIKRTEIATGNYRTFEWDYRNRLRGTALFTNERNVLTESNFKYDARNQRFYTNRRIDNDGVQSVKSSYDVNDRGNLIFGIDEHDQNVVFRSLFGAGVDEEIVRESPSGQPIEWLLFDHLGSVRYRVGDDNRIVANLKTDTFGALSEKVGDGGQAGREVVFMGRSLEEDGLYFFRSRYYDPSTGRFISDDTIGFRGGDQNLGRFVLNNPVSLRDPFGTSPEFISEQSPDLADPAFWEARGGYLPPPLSERAAYAFGPANPNRKFVEEVLKQIALEKLWKATKFEKPPFMEGMEKAIDSKSLLDRIKDVFKQSMPPEKSFEEFVDEWEKSARERENRPPRNLCQ